MKLWDVETGQHLFTFKGQKGWITALAFSPDGTRIASADGEGKVAPSGMPPRRRTSAVPTAGATTMLVSLVVSPDGKSICGGGSDPGRVRVWDAATGRELCALRHTGHADDAAPGHPPRRGDRSPPRALVRYWRYGIPMMGRGCARGAAARSLGIGAVAYSPDGPDNWPL